VELLTDWPDRLAPGVEVWLEGDAEAMRIARVESGGRVPVLHFEGVATREAAQALAGRYLEAGARTLPDASWYWSDLIGLRVEEPGGRPVGELVEIFRAGGNEVYRVVGPGGERLIPALRATVVSVDLEARLMVVATEDAEEVR
jgi:16S rRNA processing protein RimM